jgi:glyoxalase superfamily protein
MDTLDFQVTIDATQPHVLADWWAETLGWEVAPTDEAFVRRMIAEGLATEADTQIHRGGLVWKEGAAISRPEGRRIYFQAVPEAKSGKNRVHLDLRPAAADVDARIAELVARGATVLHTGQQGPHRWTTLADPEGNEFCVT